MAPSPGLSWRAARCTQQAPGATTPLRHPLLITARMGHRAGGVGPTLGRRSSRSKRLAAPSGTAQASGRIGTGALSPRPSLGSPPARPRGRPEPPGPTQPARLRERAGCAGAKPGSRPPRLPASHPPAPRPCHPGRPSPQTALGSCPGAGPPGFRPRLWPYRLCELRQVTTFPHLCFPICKIRGRDAACPPRRAARRWVSMCRVVPAEAQLVRAVLSLSLSCRTQDRLPRAPPQAAGVSSSPGGRSSPAV